MRSQAQPFAVFSETSYAVPKFDRTKERESVRDQYPPFYTRKSLIRNINKNAINTDALRHRVWTRRRTMIKRQRKNRLKSLFGKIFKKTREHDCTVAEVDACADGSETLASYRVNAHGAENSVDIQEAVSMTNNALHEALRDRSTTCTSYALNDGATHCSADQTTAGLRTANGDSDNSRANNTKEQQYTREAFTDQSGNRNSHKNRNGHSNSTDECLGSTSQTSQRTYLDPSDVSCEAMVEKSSVGVSPIACWEYVDSEDSASDGYINGEHVADRLYDLYDQPLTPFGTVRDLINLPHGASPQHPSYKSTVGKVSNKNNGNGLATSWESSSRYGSGLTESHGSGVQRTKSYRVPLKALQSATDEENTSDTEARPQVTLRRRSTISSSDHAQQATTGTVHYHLNIENCDGVNVYVNGTDMCQLPSRSVHVSRVGDVKRLSWVVDMDGAVPTDSTSTAALPARVDEGAGEHPWNTDPLDVLPPDDKYDLSGTTKADNHHRKHNTRSTGSGINRLLSHQSRERPDPHTRHAMQYQRRRYGEAKSTQASADVERRYVDIPEVLQRGPDSHPVVIDGRFPRRNLPNILNEGPRRLKPGTSSLPLFGAILRRTTENTRGGTAHDRETGIDQARYTPSETLLRGGVNIERDCAVDEPERSLSTRRITEQLTTHDIDAPIEISKEPPSQRSINVGSASAKPVAVVMPSSRISNSRNGRLQTRGTTRGTSSTDTSMVSGASVPSVENVTRDVNERLLPTTARNAMPGERSTAPAATISGYAIENHLQTIVAAIKLQLLRVPGVLIVSIRDSRIAVFLSEDRINVEGVDRFMRLHGVSEEDYSCELLPRRVRTQGHAQSGRLAVR